MDIDAALRQLRDLPADPRLAGMESAVLDAIARPRRSAPLSGGFIGAVTGLALVMGALGAIIPGGGAPSSSVAPFGMAPALAPSSLLVTAR
ncbi:hypothetical protein [Sphingobium lignivorans]|uniref:Dihydroorotate dehydrogenase n=1 Tax=Sphingobium lignivorans TaxID=2735886 RepID=A0ABR6NII1_9SPHN|nr:hypothetical protein [Sphingobium lignivorans]MBB5987088.1 hypothetical protein [Sphingobium lignivorans]